MKSKRFQYQGSYKVPDEETLYHQTILFCVIDNVTLARLVWLLAYQLSSNGNIKKKWFCYQYLQLPLQEI